MHHVRFVIRHGNCFRYSSPALIENALKRLIPPRLFMSNSVYFSQQLSIRNVSSSHRFLSSKSPEDNNEDGSAASEKPTDSTEKNEKSKSAKAKTKLDNLLLSIVKESKEAAEKKSKQQNTIDFKLAVPEKQKPVPKIEEIKPPEQVEAEEDLGKEMVQAVKQVAESVEGDPKLVESELVQKLKTQVGKKINLSDVFAGMKIDRKVKPESTSYAADKDLSRAHRVRRLLDEKTQESARIRRSSEERMPPRQRRTPPSKPSYVPIDLFGATPLGIFTAKVEETTSEANVELPKLETWEALHARDLKLAVTHPPANGFEEMILWTEQGKLWKFPINNEQDLDEESKVPFHEHVFLEPRIEDWCPKRGPIRHFMELVCVGLSKNPFLTVQEKHEQIEWYHEYFKGKADIIKEVGAGEIK